MGWLACAANWTTASQDAVSDPKDARDTEVACVRQGFSAVAMKAVTFGQAS
jgi:hypothetical protein